MEPDNITQLTDADELSLDGLRSYLRDAKYTVDELYDALEEGDYTADQIRVLIEAEENRDNGPRSTAIELLHDELNHKTEVADQAEPDSGPEPEPELEPEPDPEPDPDPESDRTETDSTETVTTEAATAETGADGSQDVTADGGESGIEDADLSGAEANTADESPRRQRAIMGGGATRAGVDGIDLPHPYSDNAPETVRIVTESMDMSFAGHEFEPGEHDIPYTLRVKQGLESTLNRVRLSEDDPLHPSVEDDDE